MRLKRRAFLQNCLLCTTAAVIGVSGLAAVEQTSSGSESDLIARMTWMNPLVFWHRFGKKIQVHTGAKTDFWREPPGGTSGSAFEYRACAYKGSHEEGLHNTRAQSSARPKPSFGVPPRREAVLQNLEIS